LPEQSFEKRLSGAAADHDALGAERLVLILEQSSEGFRQAAFDCLELWGGHPGRIEALYAAALMFYECNDATTMRARPSTGTQWPFHREATGWHLDLLYARLLVLVGRIAEAMAHYGTVLSKCDSVVRKDLVDEVMNASKGLDLAVVQNR
jgi:hypothetical protein